MRVAPALLALVLGFGGFVDAAEAAGPEADAPGVDAASALLSRYPAGMVPVEPSVIGAIDRLSRVGGRAEIPVLRSLVENERDEIAHAATSAILAIRHRQRDEQRDTFAVGLPNWPDLAVDAAGYRSAGLGREEAVCAAYADFVLGDPSMPTNAVGKGRALDRLAAGAPREALAIAQGDGTEAVVAATAREDMGDVPGAVRIWGTLAASGMPEAREALDRYGVDVERLLLGMLVGQHGAEAPDPKRTDAQVLEVLVRNGGNLTVSVLAERTRHTTPSEGAAAVDALARMLDRQEPLPVGVEGEARRALRQASVHGPGPVAAIASEALSE